MICPRNEDPVLQVATIRIFFVSLEVSRVPTGKSTGPRRYTSKHFTNSELACFQGEGITITRIYKKY